MRMKRKRKKRKKRIISLLLAAAVVLPGMAAKKKAAAEPYVLLDGTVFRESGFALPNAEVAVIPDPMPDAPPSKVKKMQTVSDSRGEFAFRLPMLNMRYVIKVSAKGYRREEKPVTVQGEDRLDVTFQLHEESK
jgi:Carboxypeptidase regulatory-like domain